MLRFFKQFYGEDAVKEVTYEKALDTLLTTYKDNDLTREWLTQPGKIECTFSVITVTEE